jgi:hypothetical protein
LARVWSVTGAHAGKGYAPSGAVLPLAVGTAVKILGSMKEETRYTLVGRHEATVAQDHANCLSGLLAEKLEERPLLLYRPQRGSTGTGFMVLR